MSKRVEEAVAHAGTINRVLSRLDTAKQNLKMACEELSTLKGHLNQSMRLARSVDDVTIIAQEVESQ